MHKTPISLAVAFPISPALPLMGSFLLMVSPSSRSACTAVFAASAKIGVVPGAMRDLSASLACRYKSPAFWPIATCGIDWAQDHHDIAIVDTDGQLLAKRRIPNRSRDSPN